MGLVQAIREYEAKEFWCFRIWKNYDTPENGKFACCQCREIVESVVLIRTGREVCMRCGHARCELPDAVQKVETWPESENTPS